MPGTIASTREADVNEAVTMWNRNAHYEGLRRELEGLVHILITLLSWNLTMPLKVIIVGAGLGGLAAAIAFTRAGHDVEVRNHNSISQCAQLLTYPQVFEKSSFHNKVGAAIHLAPNATRVLKAWDCDLKSLDPTPCDHMSLWKNNGDFIATVAVTKDLQAQLNTKDEWLLVHRVDLHNGLRELAEKGFEGRKPKIHLSCAVSSVVSTFNLPTHLSLTWL